MLYNKCINLAKLSKGANERYGAILVKNGEIIGEGYNRAIAHQSFGKLKRFIKQSYANHAEIESLNDFLLKKYPNEETLDFDIILNDLKGSDIYVAGYFNKSKQLFFKSLFTCVKCIPYLEKYGIENIFVPLPDGWQKIPIEDALKGASTFKSLKKGGIFNNRLKSLIGDYKIDLVD